MHQNLTRLGFEGLRVQGLWLGDDLEACMPDRMMRGFAGNMFDSMCLGSTLVVAHADMGAEELDLASLLSV